MLRAPTAPITVPANLSMAGSMQIYGPDHGHNRASHPQYCWLHDMLRAPNRP